MSRLSVFIGRTCYWFAVVRLAMALLTTRRSVRILVLGWVRPLADSSYRAMILIFILLYYLRNLMTPVVFV